MASVNRPTIQAQKEQDINNKLQMYGILAAFNEGKVPSNKQIDVALNSFLASRWLSKPNPQLSEEGRALIGDVKDVVDKAKQLLLTKNEGNLLQDFIYQCQVAGTGSASTPNAGPNAQQAKQHGKQALDGLRTLGTLLISNGQFRKLLNDVQLLARDMAGDVASKAGNKAASKVNPNQDELDRIDEPEEDDTWHDTPDSGDAQNLKEKLKSKAQRAKPFDSEGIKQAASDAQSSGNQQGGSLLDKASAAAKSGAGNLQNQSRQNVPDEDQEDAQRKKDQVKETSKANAREARDKTKNYLKEKVPKERRDQTIYRLKKMIVEIQGHQDYMDAIDTLLSLAENYQGHAKEGVKQSAGALRDAHTDGGISAAEDDLKILIERFANYTSTDDFFDALNQFYRDADRDPEFKGWFKHADVFVRKALKERGWIMQDQATDEWNKLYDQGDFLFNDRYKNHTQRLVDESQFLADQFNADEQNTAFADSLKRLFNDLGTDDNGKATFKPHLVKDVFNVVIPDLFESVRYIPVPRIEYSDPMADAIIENLIIEGDNLMPNLVEFGNDNYFRFGRKGVSNAAKNKVMGSVSGIQMDLKDISYYIHKKHGFPSITDTGLMDIFLGGSGFSFKLAMETADPSDSNHFFKVNSVIVDIKHMNIRLKKSKYKLMFSVVKPLLLKVMTPIITKVIEKVIKDKIHELDAFLYGIYQEAKRATKEAANSDDPQGAASSIFQSYWDAFKTKIDEKQRKAKEKSADKAVNVAVTKQDSMFKNINLPGGISTKATEYKELAQKGVKWESPIFSIGSARETTGLPAARHIKRRPHETAPSEIRGPKNLGQGMDAYSKQGESDIYNEESKYGGTGNYGGNTTNAYEQKGTPYSNQQQGSQNYYDGQQDYSQQGYSSSQPQYAQQSTYAQTGSNYPLTNGSSNDVYSQSTYPQGYTPASTGYTSTDAYGTGAQTGAQTGASYSSPTTGYSTQGAQSSGYSTQGTQGSTAQYSPTGTSGTTLGMSNPVISGRF